MLVKMKQNYASPLLGNMMDELFNHGNPIVDRATPPSNIFEQEKSYTIQLAIPGVPKEKVQINTIKDRLYVKFEQDGQVENTHGKVVKEGFKLKSFSTHFIIGDLINVENIEATCENGILSIVLPKVEKAENQSKAIQIK